MSEQPKVLGFCDQENCLLSPRVAELESALKTLWGAVVDAYMASEPADAKKSAAFLKVDRELRRLGVLPTVKV